MVFCFLKKYNLIVVEGEKELAEQELQRLREEYKMQSEEIGNKHGENQALLKNIQKLEDTLEEMKIEKEGVLEICSELKMNVGKLEEKISSQEDNNNAYKEKIYELESHIKDLCHQLEKWTVITIGNKSLMLQEQQNESLTLQNKLPSPKVSSFSPSKNAPKYSHNQDNWTKVNSNDNIPKTK